MSASTGPSDWRLPSPFGWRTWALLVVVAAVLWRTGADIEIDGAVRIAVNSAASAVGLTDDSQALDAFTALAERMWPPQLADEIEIGRIPGFDPHRLPLFAHVETRQVETRLIDPLTGQLRINVETRDILVRPFGYAIQVAVKLIETLEIALWGTLLAVTLGAPLALLSARGLSPHPVPIFAARAVVAFLRSAPELITALFFVLTFGFGPVAGVMALALHAAGFLGKFYAEDIENADPGPREALAATGAGRLKVLRHAILPQVMPQYVAYTLYILDRNVRMATVIGLVGAGGIGQELKGRYDLYDYGHVATILIAIFLLVLALDQLAARIRRSLI